MENALQSINQTLFLSTPLNFKEFENESLPAGFIICFQLRYFAFSPENYPPTEWLPTLDNAWYDHHPQTFEAMEEVLVNVFRKIQTLNTPKEAQIYFGDDIEFVKVLRDITQLAVSHYRELKNVWADDKKLYSISVLLRRFMNKFLNFLSGKLGETEFTNVLLEYKEYKPLALLTPQPE